MDSGILFFSEGLHFHLKGKGKIRKWLNTVITREGKKAGSINYIFCDDTYLLSLNNTYLKHDTYTDILTFPGSESPQIVSGDIFISIPRIIDNAKKYHHPFEEELYRVMVHGVLHLVGYNDKSKSEKAEMNAAENLNLLDIL